MLFGQVSVPVFGMTVYPLDVTGTSFQTPAVLGLNGLLSFGLLLLFLSLKNAIGDIRQVIRAAVPVIDSEGLKNFLLSFRR